MNIKEELFALQDISYGDFQAKLTPGIPRELFIGVRVPKVRKLAKKLAKEPEASNFLKDLPHKYYDENMLHGLLLSEMKDYDACIEEIDKFLPYVDNWAVCDILSPKIFNKNKTVLLEKIKVPASVHSEEYYVRMMIAWFFATALAKQWDATIQYIEDNRLDTWTHNKAILKARESNRITPKQKEYLKSLKR